MNPISYGNAITKGTLELTPDPTPQALDASGKAPPESRIKVFGVKDFVRDLPRHQQVTFEKIVDNQINLRPIVADLDTPDKRWTYFFSNEELSKEYKDRRERLAVPGTRRWDVATKLLKAIQRDEEQRPFIYRPSRETASAISEVTGAMGEGEHWDVNAHVSEQIKLMIPSEQAEFFTKQLDALELSPELDDLIHLCEFTPLLSQMSGHAQRRLIAYILSKV